MAAERHPRREQQAMKLPRIKKNRIIRELQSFTPEEMYEFINNIVDEAIHKHQNCPKCQRQIVKRMVKYALMAGVPVDAFFSLDTVINDDVNYLLSEKIPEYNDKLFFIFEPGQEFVQLRENISNIISHADMYEYKIPESYQEREPRVVERVRLLCNIISGEVLRKNHPELIAHIDDDIRDLVRDVQVFEIGQSDLFASDMMMSFFERMLKFEERYGRHAIFDDDDDDDDTIARVLRPLINGRY